jgi:hydrogenase/urease accessory protein HupE
MQPVFPDHCLHIDDPALAGQSDEGTAYWRIDCGAAGLRGERVSVSELDGSRVDVIVEIAWLDQRTASAVLRSGADTFLVPAAATIGSGIPADVVLRNYGRLGVEHILLGADHLLFVLGLVLLVDTWGMLLKTISAFTVAHSLALALAVLGVVTVPAAPVEALIALSIVLVALELTRLGSDPPTLSRRYPWAVAFGFGLVHGLGFAGALAQIGLPPDQIPLALLAFNLGVELGQLLFVSVLLAPLAMFTRVAAARPQSRLIPAYAIGTIATAWVFERIWGFWHL